MHTPAGEPNRAAHETRFSRVSAYNHAPADLRPGRQCRTSPDISADPLFCISSRLYMRGPALMAARRSIMPLLLARSSGFSRRSAGDSRRHSLVSSSVTNSTVLFASTHRSSFQESYSFEVEARSLNVIGAYTWALTEPLCERSSRLHALNKRHARYGNWH